MTNLLSRLLNYVFRFLTKRTPVDDEFIDSEVYPSRPTFWQRLTGRSKAE